MAGSMKSNEDSIKALLPGLLKDRGWEKQLDLHSVFLGWSELAGGEMREHARPLKIERGVLWLEVENSSWLQQFQFEKLGLLDTLNNFLRVARLKDIKMILRKDVAPDAQATKSTKVSFVKPSKEKIAAFQKQVECIADEQCRDALMQFWYLAQACKRKKE